MPVSSSTSQMQRESRASACSRRSTRTPANGSWKRARPSSRTTVVPALPVPGGVHRGERTRRRAHAGAPGCGRRRAPGASRSPLVGRDEGRRRAATPSRVRLALLLPDSPRANRGTSLGGHRARTERGRASRPPRKRPRRCGPVRNRRRRHRALVIALVHEARPELAEAGDALSLGRAHALIGPPFARATGSRRRSRSSRAPSRSCAGWATSGGPRTH